MAGYIDTQQRLILRNRDFLSKCKSEYLHSSDLFAVNLRKSKRKHLQNQKRLKEPNSHLEVIPNDQICYYLCSSSTRSEAFSQIVDLFGSNIDQSLILQGLKTCVHQKYQKPNGNDFRPEHVNRMIGFLEIAGPENPEIANSALEILINLSIYFKDSVDLCLNKRAIPTFDKFFNSDNESLSTNMIWFITNVSSSNERLKQALLEGGFVESLIKLLENLKNEESIETVVWSLSLQIKDYESLTKYDAVSLIRKLSHVIRYEKEASVRYSLITLFYLGSRNNVFLQVLMKEGLVTESFHLLDSQNMHLVYNFLKLLNLIIYAELDQHIQILYDLGLLSKLSMLSLNEHPRVRKEVYMIYYNLVASKRHYRQTFIQDYSFSNLIYGLLDEESEVKTETSLVFCNLSNNCTDSDFFLMFSQGFFSKIIQVLKSQHTIPADLITDLLSSIGKLLKYAKSEELSLLSQQGFEDVLNQLSYQDECSQVTENLLKTFFSDRPIPTDSPDVFSLC